MKKLVLIIAFAFSTSLIFAQGSEQDSAMTRKEKRKAEIEKQYLKTENLIDHKNFVLESDFLLNRYGRSYWVSPMINFIKVEPDNVAVIQTGNDNRIGPNGVGGVTAKGKITQWKVLTNDRSKTLGIMMTVSTPVGIYDVNFSVSPDGNATAFLSGIYGGRLTFEGDLVHSSGSGIYEGWSL